jgi:hypothetical protein
MSCERTLRHLGITAPKKSPRAYANNTSVATVSVGISFSVREVRERMCSEKEEVPLQKKEAKDH